MNLLSKLFQKFAYRLERYSKYYQLRELKKHLGAIDDSVVLKVPDVCSCPEKIFLGPNTSICEHARFIISPMGEKGKFIMKQYSNSAQGLTVITGTHNRHIGEPSIFAANSHKYDTDIDVIVEEDVSIGANVTLLAGSKLGRGSEIAANSVVCSSIPPYAIAMGNPAQVIGFCFTPEQIVEHEQVLYPESERLPLAKLEKNYEKYYVNQRDKIAGFMNLQMR